MSSALVRPCLGSYPHPCLLTGAPPPSLRDSFTVIARHLAARVRRHTNMTQPLKDFPRSLVNIRLRIVSLTFRTCILVA